MRAVFIGNSSMGFRTGTVYTIKTACEMVDKKACLCVYDIFSNAWCPYSNLEMFLKNWRLV